MIKARLHLAIDGASPEEIACGIAAAADTSIRDPVFHEWMISERRRLADTATTVLEKLCTRETGEARITVAKRIVALDPLREAPHRILMQSYY